jgi:hypothetical protein
MASVPNLPIAPAVPIPGAVGALDPEGCAVDLFAQLLGAGPVTALVAGPGATSGDEVTLRAAPPEGDADSDDGDITDADASQPGIIPLLQAQSGFPVAVVPAAPAMPAPISDTATPVSAAGVQLPAPRQGTGQSAPDAQAIDPEAEAGTEIVGAAVKAAVEKIAGKPAIRAGKPGRSVTASGEQAKPVETTMPATQPQQAEPVAARVEAAVQTAVRIPVAFAPEPVAPQASAPVAASSAKAVPDVAELVVERQLDIANDNRWLDRLARDIARTSAGDEPLRFRLHPQTLGHLQVELTQSDRGANVRLTVETAAARNILVDAQPRLAAEARAQGVRLAGTEVELGTSDQHNGDARRHDAQPQNIVRVVRGQSASNSSEPAQGRSDRYA